MCQILFRIISCQYQAESKIELLDNNKKFIELVNRKKYIECRVLSEITPDILDKVTDSKIIRYMDYLKESGIKLNTLLTKKNQMSSFWEYLKTHHYCRDNVIQMIKSSEYKPVKTNRMKMEKCHYMRTFKI